MSSEDAQNGVLDAEIVSEREVEQAERVSEPVRLAVPSTAAAERPRGGDVGEAKVTLNYGELAPEIERMMAAQRETLEEMLETARGVLRNASVHLAASAGLPTLPSSNTTTIEQTLREVDKQIVTVHEQATAIWSAQQPVSWLAKNNIKDPGQ